MSDEPPQIGWQVQQEGLIDHWFRVHLFRPQMPAFPQSLPTPDDVRVLCSFQWSDETIRCFSAAFDYIRSSIVYQLSSSAYCRQLAALCAIHQIEPPWAPPAQQFEVGKRPSRLVYLMFRDTIKEHVMIDNVEYIIPRAISPMINPATGMYPFLPPTPGKTWRTSPVILTRPCQDVLESPPQLTAAYLDVTQQENTYYDAATVNDEELTGTYDVSSSMSVRSVDVSKDSPLHVTPVAMNTGPPKLYRLVSPPLYPVKVKIRINAMPVNDLPAIFHARQVFDKMCCHNAVRVQQALNKMRNRAVRAVRYSSRKSIPCGLSAPLRTKNFSAGSVLPIRASGFIPVDYINRCEVPLSPSGNLMFPVKARIVPRILARSRQPREYNSVMERNAIASEEQMQRQENHGSHQLHM